jgi:malic enzyme
LTCLLPCSPGAFPCLGIPRQPSTAFDNTPKGNFAVQGTAVFGLGDLAAPAAKPLMESKAALFKGFVDLD